jgi:hypothetical protein
MENALHARSSKVVIHTISINIQKSSVSVCRKWLGEESRSHPLAQFSPNAAANSGLPACAPKKPVASTANLRFVVS